MFTFWNGDEYTGKFSALRDKQKIVREGKGIYKTSDNELYDGYWENDTLKIADKIVFSDGSELSGTLDGMMMQGRGKYQFQGNIQIECSFTRNKIVGNAFLTDSNKCIWKGNFNHNHGNMVATFQPSHPLWQAVLNLPGKNRISIYESQEENADVNSFFTHGSQ